MNPHMSTSEFITSNQKSELDLSQPDDIVTYLKNTPFASTRAESLSGGTANFIFRLHLSEPLEAFGGEQTVVFKHAKSWIASNKAFEYDVERQDFEATALRHVHSFLPADALATVPAVLYHDPEAHVVIMEDAGPSARNLKDLLRQSPLNELASRELGTALGQFLAAVHVNGSTGTDLLAGVQKNDDSRRLTAWVTYGRLSDTLKGLGVHTGVFDPPLVGVGGLSDEQVAEISRYASSVMKEIYEAQTVFTMGDFWTGNIVVRLTPGGEIGRIFVVDWEMAKPGLAFLDYAQFTAEMNTLRRFHPEADTCVNTALDAYADAYRSGVQIGEQFVRSAAAHVGAHLISITPGVKTWGSKQKMREVVEEGIEYLLGGMHGNAEWLRSSVVGGLLRRNGE